MPPADSLSRTCTVTPPSGAVLTRTNVVVNGHSQFELVPTMTFRKVVFTGVTFTDGPAYQTLCEVGTGNGVKWLPTGKFRSPVGNEMANQSPTTVTGGVRYATVTLTFTNPITTSRLYAMTNQGSALRMTADKIEFFP